MGVISSIAAVRVGAVRAHAWEGREVLSGAVKQPVDGPVLLGPSGLTGDEQADKVNHGGPDKAVLLYPQHHYPRWRAEQGLELPDGALFENLTLADVGGTGPDESTVVLGEVWRIGAAVVEMTQPRSPCWKLARRWGIPDMVVRVQDTGWSGWYARVLEPGQVCAGDSVEVVSKPSEPTMREVARVMNIDKRDLAAARALLNSQHLPARWRQKLIRRLTGALEDDSARITGA